MILITGGSGQLAKLIAKGASSNNLDIIVGSHNPAKGNRVINFDRPESLNFDGIKTVLMVSAGYAEDDTVIARHAAVITAAEKQGVQHIVYTSLTGTGDHLGFALAHRWTEQRLKQSALQWTILRNGLYAELIGALCKPENGAIEAPFGQGRISPVARKDLADAAVTVLSDPAAHAGCVYELSGTDAWAISNIAQRLSVEYAPASLGTMRAALADQPLLPFQPAMLMSIFSASAAGFLHSDRTDLPALLSSPPRDTLSIAVAAAMA